MKKLKRDALARELAKKYGEPYQEIRKEVCRQISSFALTINDNQKPIPPKEYNTEEEAILGYFKNKYGR